MSVHIVKLCVGVETIEDLARWQHQRLHANKREMGREILFHKTRMVPKRHSELSNGGSIYWVIRGVIQVRQQIVGFEGSHRADGTKCCLIVLDPELVPVRPTPRRAFQGWRYLEPDDAPPDLALNTQDDLMEMPSAMRRQLAELCLL